MYYKYNVLSETGIEIKAVEEGFYPDIRNSLQQKKHYILSLEPDYFKSIKSVFTKRRIKSHVLSVFFEDFKNMIRIGININESVSALIESSVDSVLTKSLSMINEDLAKGFSLTESFEKTDVFPPLVLNMLKVGEKSGQLDYVFSDLSAYYSRQAEFSRGLKNAAVYPLVIFCLLFGIMFYVSFKVIPHLQGLVPIGQDACFATKLVLFITGFLKRFWVSLFILPAVLFFIYARLRRNRPANAGEFYYKIPLIGTILKDMAFSAVFSNLALLQKNGINIADGLSLIYSTTVYKFMAKKILKLKDYILSGLSFWQALEKDPFFPSFVYYSVKKGEEMGKIDEYLYNLSKYYFDKVNRQAGMVLSFVQPVLLVFCALFLLLIVSAFIIPVYSNLSNIAGGNVKL